MSGRQKPIRVPDLLEKKRRGERITMLTAYDYALATLIDRAGVDCVLVGDSLGMVVMGHSTTLPVTMDVMVHHTQAVRRGVRRALLVSDMPFMSYQTSVEQGIANAGRLLKEGGADAVKVEGGRHVTELVRRLVEIGIPVMGHLGMTPQSVHQMGGFRLQGATAQAGERLRDEAQALCEAGVFSIVLEKIPARLAAEISREIPVPTIGIGAGPGCDGQVLVTLDMLGMFDEMKLRFVKQYAQIGQAIEGAVQRYVEEVEAGTFPGPEHSYDTPPRSD